MTMKLNLQRETLLKPLQMVIGVVERKQTLPILSNVLLNTDEHQLSITGTDLEVELIGHSPLENAGTTNKLTVPGRKLMDICKALPEGAPIELYQDKSQVIVSSGKSRFSLSTLPAEDFPNVNTQEANVSFEIPQSDLRYLLQRSYFAMAQQDVRYYLNGMLFEATNSKLTAVATDGHRLAMNSVSANIDIDHRIQVIIPRKGILELMRLLDETDQKISITIGTNHISIIGNGYKFTSKLVEGRFPDYNRVVPKGNTKAIVLDKEVFKHALSRAAILCNEKFRGLRFELRKGSMKILANNPEQEAAEEELQIVYDDENLDIGFNVNYVLDVLSVLKSETVRLCLQDANSSLLIEEESSDGDSAFVIMPMRL